ncbi:MAG TPA: hypothetical protein VNL38_00210 [Candidatus Nitrosotenuis sp.]|nr:hypothetical protein [Candidatus Nitrosotenuis sp.]
MRALLHIALTSCLLAAPASAQQSAPAPQTPPQKADRLQDRTRLEIVRYVSGEFARAVQPLSATKDGIRLRVGKPVEEKQPSKPPAQGVVIRGPVAANPGDRVQITQVRFEKHEIQLDINGGSKQRRRLRDRLQVSVGGIPTVTSTPVSSPGGVQGVGATIIVDFGRPLPDVTPDELKEILSPYLDFRSQRSASVDWVSTLPPEIQQAIKERRAVVGMDREMVIAAMGRPERKVRERTEEGLETEDWIYGDPPGKTIFVTFAGEKVIRVKEFPR